MISSSKIYSPEGAPGLGSHVTHLGIGAHSDDLEFMALEGILQCYDSEASFVGVTCTDGRGSSRIGRFADFTGDDMVRVRHDEQKKAADLGRYAAMIQLGHSSSAVKSDRQSLVTELLHLLEVCQPETVYTHNLADKHPSHIGVALATIDAIRQMSEQERPIRVLGCEVWRGLDWMGDDEKVAMNEAGTGSASCK